MVKTIVRVLISLVVVLAFTGVRLIFLPALGNATLFTTLYPAIILTALFLGPAASVSAVLFSVLSADYFLIEPKGTLFLWDHPRDILSMGVFAFNGLLICLLTALLDRHRDRAKRLEAERLVLKESERIGELNQALTQRLDLALKAGRLGVWDWNIETDELLWDDRMYELYGIKRDDFSGAYAAWLAGLHPDDRVTSNEFSLSARRGEVEYDTEFRVIWPNGTIHHLKAFGIFVRDSQGNPVRQIGVNQDITERKRAEAALRKSENRFRRAMEESPCPIMIHAEDGEVLLLSRTWSTLTGYLIEDVPTVAEWTRKAYGQEGPATLEKIQSHFSLERCSAQGESMVTCADGSHRIWDFSSILLGRLPDGRQTAMSMAFDVTERKGMEEALMESEFFFKESQKAAAIGSYRTDFVSGRWKSSEVLDGIFGIDVGYDRSVQGWLDIVHPDDQPMMDLYLREEVIAKGQRFSKEYRIIRQSDGETRWVFGLGEVSFDTQGNLSTMSGTIQDITDQKRDEQERAKLQAQLYQSQKMENLGSLAGGIAHDMNNVLAVILSLASSKLMNLPASDPSSRSFDKISKAAERGGAMIKRLLSFARTGPVEEKLVDMNALIDEEVSLLEQTTQSMVQFKTELAPDLKPVSGDSGALSHAVMNLCINAIDALVTPGTIIIRTFNRGEARIEVQIEDSGTGMTKEVLSRAIDPFFTTKPMGKGTGLGLSLVFSTVKAHHGQMEIQSEPGRGTLIKLTFPACDLQAGICLEPEVDHGSLVSASLNVLLVDDDEMIRDSLQETLEALGHQVTVAASGKEALGRLEAGYLPDVAVLDMNMPELNGAETLARLRLLRPALPVVLATGRTDQSVLDLVDAFPHAALLPKPFSGEELKQKLEMVRGL